MGKGIKGYEMKLRDKDTETKVLFKKSNTIFTHSRTCSGVSQCSKSGILQLKKRLERRHNYYLDGGKVKRDLSMETDICILRRYYRTKRNKQSSYLESSAKSKYSTVLDTEADTIDEYPDTSACGDNETTEIIKSNQHTDIATLMIDNLRDLLNKWIQKHILDNKSTKQKINTVLDDLIQKLDEKKIIVSSSGSTYVLQRKVTRQTVKNKKIETGCLTCQCCKQRARSKLISSANTSQKNSSVLSVPVHCRDIRIISTLSIPRCFHKRDTSQNNSWYKVKKIKHKNIILSIDKSKNVINSSYDLLAISAKSSKKRTNVNVNKKKRHIVFHPKPSYKSPTDTTSTLTNNESIRADNTEVTKNELDDMPSILKSLYTDNPPIISSPDKNVQYEKKSDYTMTDSFFATKDKRISSRAKGVITQDTWENKTPTTKHNETVVKFVDATSIKPSISQTVNFTDVKHKREIDPNKSRKPSCRGKISKRKRTCSKMITTFKPIKPNPRSKQFTFLYKKAKDHKSQGRDFVRQCNDILEYFADFDKNKNIKLDVQISVLPLYYSKTKDASTDISKSTFDYYGTKRSATLLYNVQPVEVTTQIGNDPESTKYNTENENSSDVYTPEIIPILDGAISQDKYFNTNSVERVSGTSNPVRIERSTITAELEIVQEISELRAVIRDLATTAEKFVNEHRKKESVKSVETNVSQNLSKKIVSNPRCESVIGVKNLSKGVQYSKDFLQTQKPQSGIKISKEPKKKDTSEFINRLTKKSTSYRIIDSESLLKVTDMTSKAAAELNENSVLDEALTCELPKSRSLYEMTSEQRNNQKVIALFCDNYNNANRCLGSLCDSCHNSVTFDVETGRGKRRWYARWGKHMKKECCTPPPPPPLPRQSCCCPPGSLSEESCRVPLIPDEGCATDGGYSTEACFPEEGCEEDDENEDETELRKCCRERRGMGFGEGCVYCLLLWIPILIIACLFYGYVLKEQVRFPEKQKVIGRTDIKPRLNSSALFVKLSDLGF